VTLISKTNQNTLMSIQEPVPDQHGINHRVENRGRKGIIWRRRPTRTHLRTTTHDPPISSPIRNGSATKPHRTTAHSTAKLPGAAGSSDSLPCEHNLTEKDSETLEREGFRFFRMRESVRE